MTTPHLIMWGVVIAVGITSAWRNPTALALTFSWLAGELTWLVTGNSLPLSTYFMADAAVIAIIYAKTIRRVGTKTYPTLWKQLYCLIVDLTSFDRWVVAIFLLGMWPLYVLNIDPLTKWYALWGLAIIQFLIAGAEAISSLRNDFRERDVADHSGNGLALAGHRGYG